MRSPIRRVALHTQVVDKLRRLIANGDIPAGERLNELQIAAILKVSRTPIREAVKLLASEGLLELSQGRGARVKRLTSQEIRDHFEVIGALERHAVESAVGRMTDEQRADLRILHESMIAAFAEADRRAYFVANQRMHAFFVRIVGNTTLMTLHETMTKRARRERPVTLDSQPRWSASMAEHDELVRAALVGEASRAGELMLFHLRRTGEAMAETAQLALDD